MHIFKKLLETHFVCKSRSLLNIVCLAGYSTTNLPTSIKKLDEWVNCDFNSGVRKHFKLHI